MYKRLLIAAGFAAAASLGIAGCLFSPTSPKESLSDGTAGDVAMEVAQMSSESPVSGLAKATAAEAESADTVEYTSQVITQSWTYDPASSWWTRSFQDSISNGKVYLRTDSLQFTDAVSRAKTTMPAWVSSTGWTHIRHITRKGLVNTFNSRFEMNVAVTKAADTTATWNGTITGTWNGATFSNTTVTNIVRKFANVAGVRWWRFPLSGTIYINMPLRTWNITFTGNGGAIATVIRKSDGKERTITIDVSTGTETEK